MKPVITCWNPKYVSEACRVVIGVRKGLLPIYQNTLLLFGVYGLLWNEQGSPHRLKRGDFDCVHHPLTSLPGSTFNDVQLVAFSQSAIVGYLHHGNQEATPVCCWIPS
jgi:hypothetical protein